MLYAGGSFGRRGNAWSDYLADAAVIAKADGSGKPVKLVWSREDDMRAGFYRPAYYHQLAAGTDKSGRITSWQQRIVGQSIMAGTFLDDKSPIDKSSVEGVQNMPYEIPNLKVELHTTRLGLPIQWWRSVGSTHTAYAVECFLDEIAPQHEAGSGGIAPWAARETPPPPGGAESRSRKGGLGQPAARRHGARRRVA